MLKSSTSFSRAGKTVILICLLIVTLVAQAHGGAEHRIEQLELKAAKVVDAARIISELYGVNIVATRSAGQKEVTLYLRHVAVKDAIETLCKITGLWYRLDTASDTFRIMEVEEYNRDLVVHRDEKTQVFTLRNPNVNLVAETIANLYGKRVQLSSSGKGSGQESINSGSQQGGSSSGSGGSVAVKETVDAGLSVDQLAGLVTSGDSGNLVSSNQLQQISTQKEPIFVTIAAEHNLVVVRTGDKAALRSITELVKSLDRQVPQVLLEMKVLDVLVGDDFSSVFNFGVTNSGLTGDSEKPILLGNNALTNGSFVFEFLNDRLKANIEFFQQNNRVRIQSTPMVLASNNRPAKLFVGEQRIIVTGYKIAEIHNSGSNVNLNSSNIVPTTQIEEVGNVIEITPYINADNTITLVLKQESSTVKDGSASIAVVSGGQVLQLPMDTINTARLEGTVIAKDNFTIAVGGLVRETRSDREQRVPWLSDIPGLGQLFTSTKQIDERSELILMITPHLIDTAPAKNETPIAAIDIALRCGERCRL